MSQSVTLHEDPLPSLVQAGATVELGCSFHLNSSSSELYSVKWYRDNAEFYRLVETDDLQRESYIAIASLL